MVFFDKNGENNVSQYKKTRKSLSLCMGAAFVVAITASSFASAASTSGNPFASSDQHGSYSQIADTSTNAKCGANTKEMKDSKCGAGMKDMKDGKCGAAMKDAKCGAAMQQKPTVKDKAPKEAKCGGM